MLPLKSSQEYQARNWEELRGIIDGLPRGLWGFRGQSSMDYPLTSTLERLCMQLHGSLEWAVEVEYVLLREFQRRYHFYHSQIPEDWDKLRWLSIMKHHDTPTRLLDVSYSAYVAAYFALKESVLFDKKKDRYEPADACLWAFKLDWLRDAMVAMFATNKAQKDYLEAWRNGDEASESSFYDIYLGKKHRRRLVGVVSPFCLNERQSIQKGVFLCPGNVNRPFEENLKRMPDWDSRQHIRKVRIAGPERMKMLEELDKMSISDASLFPGLDGFAKSLGIYHHEAANVEKLKRYRRHYKL